MLRWTHYLLRATSAIALIDTGIALYRHSWAGALAFFAFAVVIDIVAGWVRP